MTTEACRSLRGNMRWVSYDLMVYTRNSSTMDDLAALVRRGAGLDVDAVGDRHVTVVRCVRRRYSFTVDGPDALEPEDVPAPVAGVVLAPRHLWSVMVEGSATTEVTHAVRFARRLADALDGAVEDHQTGEVWSRSSSRKVSRPDRSERVSTVDLRWYCRTSDITDDIALLYLDAVTRVLPEALPRRFGDYEPLQGKFETSGADGFVQARRDAFPMLSFVGSGPVVGGHLPGRRMFPEEFTSLTLGFHGAALLDHGWRDAVREVFVRLAIVLPAFFATAEVTRGHIWSGRTMWSDGQTEKATVPLRYRDGWMGLPPIPVWWAWFGPAYADLEPLLPADRTRKGLNGFLFESSPEPLARDRLTPLTRWLPQDLFASIEPGPHLVEPVPLLRAAEVPDVLRSM
jgi:hypothetical protein